MASSERPAPLCHPERSEGSANVASTRASARDRLHEGSAPVTVITTRRSKALWLLAAGLLAAAGIWTYGNASLTRLRRDFVPWMHRLERWRDAAEETRRALRRREPTPSDPAGIDRLRQWAWYGLGRVAWISYRVEKPEHEVSATREVTRGRVRFTVGGFRADGTRVERSADVLLAAEWDPRRDPTPRDAPPGAVPESVPIPMTLTVSLDHVAGERSNALPRFHDATAEAGLGAPRHDPVLKLTNRLIAGIWPGSGVAVLDFDCDGFEDLFVADGVRSILYRNDGRGHFTDMTVKAGLATQDGRGIAATGVAAGDVDGDGFPDLFVTDAFGPARLFGNRGDSTFEEITGSSGISIIGNARSAAFADVDGDGLLHLYTTGCDTQWYFLHEYPSLPIGVTGRAFLPIAIQWVETMAKGNTLLLQKPNHTFADATSRSGAEHAGWNWSSVAADLDNDSWPDVYATNGMWGDGRDHDRELEFWWQTLAYWDDYVAGKKTFDRKGAGIAGIERDHFFRNRSGDKDRSPAGTMFEERSFLEGLDLETNGRSVVAFDANGDGALDLYIRSVQAPEALFLGTRRPDEHYLRLKLRGTPGRDNRDGVGSRITALLPGGRRVLLETGNASGYLSTGSPVAHLGLGRLTRIESLTVRWPSGKLQDVGPIANVDRTILVDEQGAAEGRR